jgi:hypothetical protein
MRLCIIDMHTNSKSKRTDIMAQAMNLTLARSEGKVSDAISDSNQSLFCTSCKMCYLGVIFSFALSLVFSIKFALT